MDLLLQHEAFLRAAFDAPDDDTPRLVYADFLEENGEAERAELIRVQCERERLPHTGQTRPRHVWLQQREDELVPLLAPDLLHRRGFSIYPLARISAAALLDPPRLRKQIVEHHPHWFGARLVKVVSGPIASPEPIATLFSLPAFAMFTTLDLSGQVTDVGVEALARRPGLQRLERLDLTDNNLDTESVRELLASPYLGNLRHVGLSRGNRIDGDLLQQFVGRFGQSAVL
jgi:uncharacterized protein (TIGR02996 family)